MIIKRFFSKEYTICGRTKGRAIHEPKHFFVLCDISRRFGVGEFFRGNVGPNVKASTRVVFVQDTQYMSRQVWNRFWRLVRIRELRNNNRAVVPVFIKPFHFVDFIICDCR